MPYNKKIWGSQDVIEVGDLNHIESGIADIDQRVGNFDFSTINNAVDTITSSMETFDEKINQIEESAANIANIQENINDLGTSIQSLNKKKATFYFPSLANPDISTDKTYSGSSALMVYNDKTVLFDCNSAGITNNKYDTSELVLNYYISLRDKGVFSNIDYIILSHYHYDHIDGLKKILTTFEVDEEQECVIYIPPVPSSDAVFTGGDTFNGLSSKKQQIYDVVNEVINTGNCSNITIIDNYNTNSPIIILDNDNNVKIELFNMLKADYDYYTYETSLEKVPYNNYSMCALVNVGDLKALFPGDIQSVAQQHIISNSTLAQKISNLSLYASHHHGIQHDDVVQYLNIISPQYTIISTNHTRGLESANDSVSSNYYTKQLFSTGYGNCVFSMSNDSIEVIEGTALQRSGWIYNEINYYVDNEYIESKHDGSKNYPFTRINEINNFIIDKPNLFYKIHIKPNDTPYDLLHLNEYSVPIKMSALETTEDKTVKINGAYISNCNNIMLSNISIINGIKPFIDGYNPDNRANDGKEINMYSLLYCQNSNIYLSNVTIDGVLPIEANSGTTIYGIINHNSNVYTYNCIGKNLSVYNSSYRYGGKIVVNSNTYDNVANIYNCITPTYIRGIDIVTNMSGNYMNNVSNSTGNYEYFISGRRALIPSSSSQFGLPYYMLKNAAGTISAPFYFNFSDSIGEFVRIKGKNKIHVLDESGSISITTQPENVSASIGDNITFITKGSGTGTIKYQWIYSIDDVNWYKATNPSEGNEQGNSEYSLTLTEENINRVYRCCIFGVNESGKVYELMISDEAKVVNT